MRSKHFFFNFETSIEKKVYRSRDSRLKSQQLFICRKVLLQHVSADVRAIIRLVRYQKKSSYVYNSLYYFTLSLFMVEISSYSIIKVYDKPRTYNSKFILYALKIMTG